MVLPSRLMSWSMTTLMRLGFTGRASGSELLCATVAVKYDPKVFDSSRGLEAGEGRGLGVTHIVEPSMVTKKSLVCLAPGAFSRNVKFCHFERLPFMRIGGPFGAGLLVAAATACCGKFECLVAFSSIDFSAYQVHCQANIQISRLPSCKGLRWVRGPSWE